MREIRFSGSVDPSVKEAFTSYYDNIYASRLIPVEGELVKTPEEIDVITRIDKAYANYFEWLGVPYPGLPLNAFHAVTSEAMAKISETPEVVPNGMYDYDDERIYYRRVQREHSEYTEWILIHESAHALAHRIQYLQRGDSGNFVSSDRRGGYMANGAKGMRLRFFNEGVTDSIAHHVKGSNPDLLMLPNPDGEQSEFFPGDYVYDQEITDIVISGIAEAQGITIEEAWRDFAKGYFTGKPNGLMIIREVFGKNSLRILDCLERSYTSWEDQLKINKPIALFLHSKVRDFRFILKEILPDYFTESE